MEHTNNNTHTANAATANTSVLPIMFDAFGVVRRVLALVLAALLAFGAVAPAAVSADTDHVVPTLDTIISGAPARYAPISPVRVVDTRHNRGAGALSPGQTARVQLITPAVRAAAGSGTITAAVVNLTAVDTTKAGYMTLWGDGARPDASSLNATGPAQTIANLVTTPVTADGTAQVFHDAGGQFLIDVTGVFISSESARAGRFMPLERSTRIVDTRSGAPLAAATTMTVDLTAHGVPTDATAAVFNLTAVDAQAPGFATVWPATTAFPDSSNLNFGVGASAATANQVYSALNNGRFDLRLSSTAHIIVDLAGYFTGTSAPNSNTGLFVAVAPTRLLDTRNANGPTNGLALPARQALAVPVSGRHGLPTSGIAGVALNTTLTATTAAGWAVNFPAGTRLPDTSSVNAPNQNHTVANHVVAGITTDGVSIYSDITTHALIDITGYFTGTTPTAPAPTQPPTTQPPAPPTTTQPTPPPPPPPTTQPLPRPASSGVDIVNWDESGGNCGRPIDVAWWVVFSDGSRLSGVESFSATETRRIGFGPKFQGAMDIVFQIGCPAGGASVVLLIGW